MSTQNENHNQSNQNDYPRISELDQASNQNAGYNYNNNVNYVPPNATGFNQNHNQNQNTYSHHQLYQTKTTN